MPETPNNKMDELLRKHADKRRQDASGFSLHPATRRLLQGEVQRQFPKPGAATGSPRSWSIVLLAWRGAAVAACGLMIVLIAGVWFFGRDRESPATAEAIYAKLEPTKPLPPSDTLSRKSAAEPESLRDQPEAPSLAKAPAASGPASPGLPGSAGGSTTVNFKGGRADTKAKAELAIAEKKLDLKDSELSSLTPAPSPASTSASPAANADFDQAAIAAKQQQVALNISDKAMAQNTTPSVLNSPASGLNSQSKMANAGQVQVNGPSGGAAMQTSALLNNQQQELAQNAPSQTPAPTQERQYLRGAQQVIAAGAEANVAANNGAPQEMAAQTQRLYAFRENASNNEAANLPSNTAVQTRAALGAVSQREERQSRDEAAPSGVLTHFVVQQRGNFVRVIDADSSVYDGTLFEENVVNAPQPTDTYGSARALDRSASRQRAFRVTGTNKTSGQSVVLDAQLPSASSTQQTFVAIQPVNLSRSRSAGVAAQAIPAVPTVPSTTRLKPTREEALSETNAVLEGSLRVGGAASQPIRARRIGP
jgi:hypothetical protein